MRLSAALIVKDEEKHLERCLQSILKVVDQIVVVDTGSIDNTVEIARRYTSKIYHHPWQNNFALHRNQSFSYCTCDWILQIDADEELIFHDPRIGPTMLLSFLEKLPPEINAVAIRLQDYRKGKLAGELDTVRLFRRGKVKYERIIHNEPIYAGDAAIFPFANLKHYGYDLTAAQKQAKSRRTIGLLLKSIENDPYDYDSLFYLAQAYSTYDNDDDNALAYALKYIDAKNEIGNRFNPSIYYLVAFICMKRKQTKDWGKWLTEGLKCAPGDLDLSFSLMQYGVLMQDPKIIASGARAFVTAFESFNDLRYRTPGRIYFNHTLEAYAAGLFYLSLAYIETGVIEMKKLKGLFKHLPTEVVKELTSKIKISLEALDLRDVMVKNRIILPNDSLEYHHAQIQPAGRL